MKLLFCLNSAPEFAGVQQYILTITKELKSKGFIPIIWMNDNEPFQRKLLENKIEYYRYDGSILALKNIWQLMQIIRRHQIKIVHANLGGAAIAGALIKYFSGIKTLVYTQHFINPASTQGGFIKKIISKIVFKLTFVHYDSVIAISSEVRNSILKRRETSANKVILVYSGIKGIQGKKNITDLMDILIVSRLEKEKGIDKLLPVLWTLYQDGYDFSVTIVGDGGQEKILKEMSFHLGMQSKINFIGKVNDVSPYYLNSGIFVNPTFFEGFGLAIVEAMSAQLPVIAFNKGGPVDIIDHNKTGYLAESYEEFGTYLKQLLKNPELATKMGVAGYERFKDLFVVDKMMEQLLKIYGILPKQKNEGEA
ncbi:MAG: hypothetical protein A2Y40_07600 [Candidatus Margulisbacteria bacterium GWF2_35_9]|nr:MAG: hypothetical protein A2Y40_07600 [Candidatus Margulisbacteria bacterium GWF2_35_9]